MSLPIPTHVRYELLRPAQAVARRQECPVAYLPAGTLEWHGEHNPLGLDAVKAHRLCCVLADRLGGLAMPPLWYGDNRDDICEIVFGPQRIASVEKDHSPLIAEKMGLPAGTFQAGGVRNGVRDSWEFFSELVERTLYQMRTLGFEATVVLTGHYPEHGPAQAAADQFAAYGQMKTLVVMEHSLLLEQGYQGDHAAKWETSLMLALSDGLVDLGALSDDRGEPNLGVLGVDPRGTASAEYGLEAIEALVKAVRAKVGQLLAGTP